MTRHVVNMNIKGCILCQNTDISGVLDDMIFSGRMSVADLIANMEARGFPIEEAQLRDHITHVYVIDDEHEDYSLTLTTNPNASNIELAKDSLKKILILEKNMILGGRGETKEFVSLLKEKRDLITLIARLEGELVDTTVVGIPDWVTKVPVIDAEVVQPKQITGKK